MTVLHTEEPPCVHTTIVPAYPDCAFTMLHVGAAKTNRIGVSELISASSKQTCTLAIAITFSNFAASPAQFIGRRQRTVRIIDAFALQDAC